MKRFEGKRALITGGTGGIGWATAKRLADEGAKVLITGRNPERLAQAKSELGVLAIANDAGDAGAADALRDAVKEHLGKVDAVFFNAGFGRFFPIGDVTSEEFAAQFNVNVRGPLLHAKALANLIEDNGAILLNTSVAQNMGMAGASIYASTKGALRTMTRVLAREFADRKIRVNAISPGPIETGFFSASNVPPEAAEQMAAGIVAQVPLARFGKASEVAAGAAFLLSSDASYVTGTELVVDGGMTEL
ncbi:MAG: SDR family oxidoreductase [Myxococcota bacterium]